MQLNDKNNLMKSIRSLLYATDEQDILKEFENIQKYTLFNDYFNKNWALCEKMWMLNYRKKLTIYGTNTNNLVES